MRWLLLTASVLLLGCVSAPPQECPACDYECDCPEAVECPESAADASYSGCLWRNISTTAVQDENLTEEPSQAANATAPEHGYGNMTFGEGNFTLLLEDVSLPAGGGEPCAMFSISNASGALMERVVVCPGKDEYWVAPDGHRFRIVVIEAAAGYTREDVWADVIIFG
ncbi:TPA: hypothetical protein EYP38_05000 [Candidatus Micrarchaeota archaeon]|nr:hypothetical protein [Candidatus Micrarchaeota archaeon]